MILKIDTSSAQRELIKSFKELSQKKVNLAITRSINSALGKTQTAAARAVTSRYNLTYSDVTSKLFVVKASPATHQSMMRGYLKAYNQPFPLSYFKPRMIKDGVVTQKVAQDSRFNGGRKAYASRRAKFLRADKKIVQNGVIVQVMKGQDKAIRNAFLAFRKTGQATVSARGVYDRGFQFQDDGPNKSLRGVGVASVLRSNNISPILKEYAENEYLRILYKELQKRVKSVGEQHSRYV